MKPNLPTNVTIGRHRKTHNSELITHIRRAIMRPREHYLQQLEELHSELRALGQLVVVSITQAIDALRQQEVEAARRIVAEDRRIDEAQYALEEHALVIMATQQPMAGDLRRLVAAIAIASELERIGDYA